MSGIVEARILDDENVSADFTRTMDLRNAKTIVSILHVRLRNGTPTSASIIVTVFRLDPGTKKKLGAAIVTHTTVTELTALPFLEEKDAADAALARFTGLFRVEMDVAFTGGSSPSATIKYTLIGKE